ncbi:hypothetical protein [Jannaschia rubra]|uniref:hypothetical protein n=1 Tax=Jannaschia rubra TaxID=282197 RepID=UPI001160C688|nr:hypothetical protein [Jannaschia rubra]
MQSLIDALGQIEESLGAGTAAKLAIAAASEDYGLKPVLLLRKFSEKHGCEPDQWSPPMSRHEMNRRSACTRARKLSQERWLNLEGVLEHFLYGEHALEPGTIFEGDGREWAFVGLKGDGTLAAVIVGELEEDDCIARINRGSVPSLRGRSYMEVIDHLQANLVSSGNRRL